MIHTVKIYTLLSAILPLEFSYICLRQNWKFFPPCLKFLHFTGKKKSCIARAWQFPHLWEGDDVYLREFLERLCDCSLEIKRHLFLGRKAMTNLDRILENRDITLPTKVHIVKAMVVIYGCQSWTIKKAECQRVDTVEPWCWRRLLRVPWIARRWNQSILKETDPEYSL